MEVTVRNEGTDDINVLLPLVIESISEFPSSRYAPLIENGSVLRWCAVLAIIKSNEPKE